MNKPKLVLQPKKEESGSGNKLAFSPQSREGARQRLERYQNEENARVVTKEKLIVVPYRQWNEAASPIEKEAVRRWPKDPDHEKKPHQTTRENSHQSLNDFVRETSRKPRRGTNQPIHGSMNESTVESFKEPASVKENDSGEPAKGDEGSLPPFRIGIDPPPIEENMDLDTLIREVLQKKVTEEERADPKTEHKDTDFPGMDSREEMIFSPKKETRSPKDPIPRNEVDLDEVGPIFDEPGIGKKPPGIPPYRKRRNLGWLKFVSSIMGAILLGSLFGYLLLMILVSGDWLKETTNIPPSSPANSAQGSQGGEGTKVIPSSQVALDPSQAGIAAAGELQLADRTFYAIQGGVFTDPKAGEAALQEAKKKGLPALLFDDESFRLFLGMSYRKEDALNLAGYFQNKGVEIYLKEYSVPGGKMLFPGAKKEEMDTLNLFLTHGTYLLEKTASWSGQGVIGKANISDEEWKKFKETHRLFLLESKQIEPILTEEQKGFVSKMTTEMNTAITGMVEYVKNPEMSYLLQSQQALLTYFDQYRKLLASAGVNVAYKNPS
ncbi:hypothetical protein [Thermicanus aegyptius]|uniref:hypothetical protein n=1 Tax=Thermicanus aegyptius TaxID=94009 RepID=UPI00048E3631|nr:hypothetical protein [Thermicanus aegyptius]